MKKIILIILSILFLLGIGFAWIVVSELNDFASEFDDYSENETIESIKINSNTSLTLKKITTKTWDDVTTNLIFYHNNKVIFNYRLRAYFKNIITQIEGIVFLQNPQFVIFFNNNEWSNFSLRDKSVNDWWSELEIASKTNFGGHPSQLANISIHKVSLGKEWNVTVKTFSEYSKHDHYNGIVPKYINFISTDFGKTWLCKNGINK